MNNIKEKSIVFQSAQGLNLWGVLSLPKGKNLPGIIVVHGFKGTKSQRKFVKLAREFAKKGIAVFRFDLSGHGDSEGRFEKLRISQQVNDLKAAYKTFAAQPNIDKNRIGILGYSLGSLVTCLFALKCPTIKALVLLAPAIDQKRLIKDWYSYYELRKWKKQGYIDKDEFRIGVQYLNEAKDYTELVSKIKIPTLILQGKKDKAVLPKYSQDLVKKFSGIKKLILIKEANHSFEGYYACKKMIGYSFAWFKKYL